MNKRANMFIFSPLALENGRGGEISSIELASGLQNFYDITLMDTNILFGKSVLSQNVIKNKLKDVKRDKRMHFATFKIFDKIFTFPYPWEILKLYRQVKKNKIIYTSSSTVKIDLLLIFFSLIQRKTKFIIGFRKPLFSERIFSLYNLKYRISILLFSLFKKRFYFHTISYHAKKFLENFYTPDKVFHVIHGVELKGFIEDGMEKKQSQTLNCIYVGNIDDVHKGVDILLDGIKKVIEENKNLRIFFEFCGEGPLESQVIELQNTYPKYVRYNGYVSNENIPEFYKRNDVFLFSSRREPFGRVIIEALAAELIIICSKTIGSIEILKGKDFAFFLQNLDANIIKEKIFEIYNMWLKNPDKFKQLKKLTKEYAFQNYSVSQEILSFKNLIEKIS
jgi:glycosyltransferase involved in cell wall biosynthesis